jgi:hypothetical protein
MFRNILISVGLSLTVFACAAERPIDPEHTTSDASSVEQASFTGPFVCVYSCDATGEEFVGASQIKGAQACVRARTACLADCSSGCTFVDAD